MTNTIYVLQKDLPDAKAGERYFLSMGTLYPESEYGIHNSYRQHQITPEWFLPLEDHEVLKAKELLESKGYRFMGSKAFSVDDRRYWDDQYIMDAWNAGWAAYKGAASMDSDARVEKFMDGAYDYLRSIYPKDLSPESMQAIHRYTEEDLRKAFGAGRKKGIQFYPYAYSTFEDYLKSI